MRKTLWLAALALLPAGAALAQPAPYSIPWFQSDAHNGARQEMIKLCRNDHRYYEDRATRPLCDNAEMAESRRYSQTLTKNGLNSVNTVEWWKYNRDLRAATLEACQRRAPYDQDVLRYCDLAREAERSLSSRTRG